MSAQQPRFVKPPESEFVALGHSRYKGRDYYGNHADELAELAWRRDLCAYQEQLLQTCSSRRSHDRSDS